jgi:sirohydrochlorin cobaltochelatase
MRALVLAAHGSRREARVNRRVCRLAERVGERAGFEAAAAAFHQGEPAFSSVLDRLSSAEVVVVPLLTSRGYYSETVIPRELQRNRCCAETKVWLTPPVGVHPGMADLVDRSVRERIEELELASPRIVIVGHGSARHAESRKATEALSAEMCARGLGECDAYFIDEEPRIEELRRDRPTGDLLVVPFLIGGGRHTVVDLRSALGFQAKDSEDAAKAPCDGRLVVLDRAVGLAPGLEDLLVDLAAGATESGGARLLGAQPASATT